MSNLSSNAETRGVGACEPGINGECKAAGSAATIAGSSGNQVPADNSNANPPQAFGIPVQNPVNFGEACAGTLSNVRRNPLREVRRNVDHRCQLCGRRDNEDMVQCDGCDRWFHFVCVHVTEEIANVSWMCPHCKASSIIVPPTNTVRPAEQQSQKASEKPLSVRSKSKASSRSEARRLKELEMQKLQDELELEKRFLERKYKILQEYGSETSSITGDNEEDKLSKIEEWLAETDRHGDEEDSGLAAEAVNEQIPNCSDKLNEHQALHMQPNPNPIPVQTNRHVRSSSYLQPMQQQYQQRQSSVPPQRNIRNHPACGVRYADSAQHQFYHSRSQNEFNQFERQPIQSTCLPSGHPRQPSSTLPGTYFGQYSREPQRSGPQPQDPNRTTFLPTLNRRALNEFVPGQGSTPIRLTQPEHCPSAFNDETICILNRSQIAARQAVPRDLPDFDGTLEDWPLFFAMFNSSTQMCGFTNEENMLRLRKCLKGKALEAVKCELLHPSNVNDILSTLRMLYGRPDAIIQSIIRKIRQLPPPNTEKLETLVNFALTVKNMVATIRACEVDDYIFNSSLRYELVERLPSSLKLDWARFARDYADPNLGDFSAWLYSKAEDASTVMTSSHEQRGRDKKDNFLNYHSESDSSTESSCQQKLETAGNPAFIQCVVCKGKCTTVAKCARFEEFGIDSRWATIKECKLCRQCLRKHNGSCKRQTRCGVNECTFLHHPLLHNSEHRNVEQPPSNATQSSKEPMQIQPSCNVHQGQSEVLFRIVPVRLYGPEKVVDTFAFIDDGSELTLIEQDLADELGIDGPTKPLCLNWTGGMRKVEHQSKLVSLQVSGVQSSPKYELSEINTIASLQIRSQTLLPLELQKKFPYLTGLPLEEYHNVVPRILIGLDHAYLGYSMKSREGTRNEPIAVKTRLGWMVYGSCIGHKDNVGSINYHSVQGSDNNEQSQMMMKLLVSNPTHSAAIQKTRVVRKPSESAATKADGKVSLATFGVGVSKNTSSEDSLRIPGGSVKSAKIKTRAVIPLADSVPVCVVSTSINSTFMKSNNIPLTCIAKGKQICHSNSSTKCSEILAFE